MRNWILYILAAVSSPVFAQPGEIERDVYFGLYSDQGVLIDSADEYFTVRFLHNDSKPASYYHEKGRFHLSLVYGDEMTIEIKEKSTQEKMIIHTEGTLDSIAFKKGNYRLDGYSSFLFGIAPGQQVTISNFSMENFIQDSKFKRPVFIANDPENFPKKTSQLQLCFEFARQFEKKHGGVNWAKNVCNDTYEQPFISDKEEVIERMDSIEGQRNNDLRIKIYPLLKSKFIKHEFFLGDGYNHVISLSEDEGVTWKKIMTIHDEWYVNLVYFNDGEKMGIDISNSGVLLISDFNLQTWKYYVYPNEDEETTINANGMVLRNENWYDSYYSSFSLSE